jgi:hypothetical protein
MIESDVCQAASTFARPEYCARLATRLEHSKRVFSAIARKNGFLAQFTATSDAAALVEEKDALEAIKAAAIMEMVTEVKRDTNETRRTVNEIHVMLMREENEKLRERLTPITFEADINRELAKYMKDTRHSILSAVDEWMNFGPNSQPSHPASSTAAAADGRSAVASSSSPPSVVKSRRVFWVRGGPGSGKSCLSAVLCDRYRHEIVGVHFCRHDEAARQDPMRMVMSLAYQMAQRIPEYAAQLKSTVPAVFGVDGRAAESSNALDIWKSLIIEPLHACKDALDADRHTAGRKFVLLVDALDEASSDPSHKSGLLDIISVAIDLLPAWAGVVVTSRPEDAIVKKLKRFRPVEMTCDRSASGDTRSTMFIHG